MPEIVNLPPADRMPADLAQLAATYADLSQRWSEANAAVQGEASTLADADRADAAEVAAAIRAGNDPADVDVSHRGDAERRHRLAAHTEQALRGMLTEHTGRMLAGLLAHRDTAVHTLQPDLQTGAAAYRDALLELRKSRARYLRTVAEIAWWQELSDRNLPSYTGRVRRTAVADIDPHMQAADAQAGRLLSSTIATEGAVA